MRSVAVFGATGALGKATVDELIKQNLSVKVLVRDIEKYKSLYPKKSPPGRVNVVQGDLNTNQSIVDTMENVDTMFLCYNTEYRYWKRDMVNWTDKIAKVASALEARIMYPGCKYNFGVKTKPIAENIFQDTKSEVGQLKIALERRLYRAAQDGANLTIVRLPNIFGPADLRSKLSKIFTSALNNASTKWRGNIEINHEIIYSKDAAAVMVKAASSQNAENKVFHIEGKKIKAKQLISDIYKIAQSDIEPIYRLIHDVQDNIKSIFSKETKLRNQLRYFDENEIFFDGSLFKKEIGEVQLTPFQDSITETYDWYNYWLQRYS